MIIPIGIDCGLAELLKNNNIRCFAFPFDWCVTYNGVSEIIKDDFNKFIPELGKTINYDYNINFVHDFSKESFINDKEKYLRRINRFKTILDDNLESIIFIRKGHAHHHHEESEMIKNDIEDAEELDKVLKDKYKNLSYTIIVILVCGDCFDTNKIYSSNSERVKIYNISTPKVDDNKFNKKLKDILKISY